MLRVIKSSVMVIALGLAVFTLQGCSPEVGSKEWCTDMKEKPKGDWSASEAKDFARHCIL